MDTIELLMKFANPEVMKTLSLSDRLTAGLITTLLGMGITFVSLVILQVVIELMARMGSPKTEDAGVVAGEEDEAGKDVVKNQIHDEEVVAAITTALALQLGTSVSNIIIRNIEKVEDRSSTWHKAGLSEHMNNSF